jgi:hypothetical protein
MAFLDLAIAIVSEVVAGVVIINAFSGSISH